MATLQQLEESIRFLRKEVSEELPIRYLGILVYLCRKQEAGVSQIASDLDIALGSISKAVKLLSEYADRTPDGKMELRGYRLLKTTQDPFERRRVIVSVTEKGHEVVNRLLGILSDGKEAK